MKIVRMKKVGFEAIIIELKIKRLASKDKSMRLTLQVDNPSDDLIGNLNRLFQCGGATVGIAVASEDSIRTTREKGPNSAPCGPRSGKRTRVRPTPRGAGKRPKNG